MADTLRLPVGFDTTELQRDLESVEHGLGRTLTDVLRKTAGIVADTAPRFTPYDPAHDYTRKDGLPHLRDTFGARAAGGTATVTTTHPGGPVHEFGGTIAPRSHGVTGHGADIHIKPSQMAHRALDAVQDRVSADLADRLERLVRSHNL